MGRGGTHEPADIVVQHLPQGLVELELVAAFIRSPEGHNRFQRRAARNRAGQFGDEDRGLRRQLETLPGPVLNGLQMGEEGRIGLWLSKYHAPVVPDLRSVPMRCQN